MPNVEYVIKLLMKIYAIFPWNCEMEIHHRTKTGPVPFSWETKGRRSRFDYRKTQTNSGNGKQNPMDRREREIDTARMMLGILPSRAMTCSLETASWFPTTSATLVGRYFSTQGNSDEPIFPLFLYRLRSSFPPSPPISAFAFYCKP